MINMVRQGMAESYKIMNFENSFFFFNAKERNIEIKNEEYRMKVIIFNT